MLRFKSTVRLAPPAALAMLMQVVTEVYAGFYADAWITSGNDGQHKVDSFHYKDAALDFRISNVESSMRVGLVVELKRRLSPPFDVLWENVGTPNEHVHIEYDPKEA